MIGNIYAIAAVAIIGGGLFGFDISSMSAIISIPQYKCYFQSGPIPDNPADCTGPSADVQGGITAAMPGGSWLGALCSGYISDLFGRKKAIMIGARIHFRIGSAQQAWTFGRGTAVGHHLGDHDHVLPLIRLLLRRRPRRFPNPMGTLSLHPPPPHSYFHALLSLPLLTLLLSSHQGLQMIPAICLFGAMFFLPESPRWLARKERWEDAHAVLTLVHGKGDPDSPFVRRELEEIRAMVEFERQNADITYLELLKPHMINRTHIGVFTQIWSQLTGMNVPPE
ncbi:MAG: hypothetical protein Q9206_006599 [Seirophora lacunosa]